MPVGNNGPRKRVLIVDDEDLVRRTIARELAGHFDVVTVAGYRQALGAILEESFWAVVTDLDFGPGRNGLDLLARIARRHPSCVRAVVSARIDPEIADRLLREGAVHLCLDKPWPRFGIRDGLLDLASNPPAPPAASTRS